MKSELKLKEIKKFVKMAHKEVSKGYAVTLEIAIKKDDVEETFKWLNTLDIPEGFLWTAMECETCQQYYDESYCHFSLESISCGDSILEASNLIKTTK